MNNIYGNYITIDSYANTYPDCAAEHPLESHDVSNFIPNFIITTALIIGGIAAAYLALRFVAYTADKKMDEACILFNNFQSVLDNSRARYQTQVRSNGQISFYISVRRDSSHSGMMIPPTFNLNENEYPTVDLLRIELQRRADECIACHREFISSLNEARNALLLFSDYCNRNHIQFSSPQMDIQTNTDIINQRLAEAQAEIDFMLEMDLPSSAPSYFLTRPRENHNESRLNTLFNPQSSTTINISRETLNADPKFYLKEFLRKSMEVNNFKFSIVGEDAVDAGGVTREVYTTLFRSLLEEDDSSFRSILDLGEDIDVYKGLGVALSKVADDESVFLKNYFDRDLFRVIDYLTVDELALLTKGEDMKAIEPIKQRLILDIPKEPGLSVRSVLEAIFNFNSKEEKTASDFEQMQELVESVLDYEGEDLDDLKEENLEEYQKTIQDSVDKWLQDNQKYVLEADRLIHITTYYKEVGQALSKGLDLQAPRLKEQASAGVSALEKIVAPLDREMLASAIVSASMDGLSNITEIACVQKKAELIQDWVRTKATDRQLYDFIQFCTGCAVLGAEQTIKISYSSQNPFEAHTCFNRLDLSTTFEQRQAPENTTDEQVYDAFIRDFEYVIIPNSGADFNAV